MLRLVFIFLSLFVTLSAVDRCERYVQDVRKYHYEVFGIDYPYEYGVGQLKQESLCRDVISNDGVGSQGVSQITYRLWASYLKKYDINDLKSTRNQIKAQAYIMKSCKDRASAPKLWIIYQVYNGGGLVNKEIKRAGSVDHDKVKPFCKRKIVTFSNGMKIDACEINYDYSVKIFKYAQKYRTLESDTYKFW